MAHLVGQELVMADVHRHIASAIALTVLLAGCGHGGHHERSPTPSVNDAMERARMRLFADGYAIRVGFTLKAVHDASGWHYAPPIARNYAVAADVAAFEQYAQVYCNDDTYASIAYAVDGPYRYPGLVPGLSMEHVRISFDEMISLLTKRGITPPSMIALKDVAGRPVYDMVWLSGPGAFSSVDVDAANGTVTVSPLRSAQ